MAERPPPAFRAGPLSRPAAAELTRQQQETARLANLVPSGDLRGSDTASGRLLLADTTPEAVAVARRPRRTERRVAERVRRDRLAMMRRGFRCKLRRVYLGPIVAGAAQVVTWEEAEHDTGKFWHLDVDPEKIVFTPTTGGPEPLAPAALRVDIGSGDTSVQVDGSEHFPEPLVGRQIYVESEFMYISAVAGPGEWDVERLAPGPSGHPLGAEVTCPLDTTVYLWAVTVEVVFNGDSAAVKFEPSHLSFPYVVREINISEEPYASPEDDDENVIPNVVKCWGQFQPVPSEPFTLAIRNPTDDEITVGAVDLWIAQLPFTPVMR